MTKLFGEAFLIIALCFSLIQSVLPVIGWKRKNLYLLACARPAAWGQFVCILIAYTLLTIAFVNSDFSIAYVAANSHPSLPLMYRLTAVWGAHEGSILLWIFILNIWTVLYSAIDHTKLAALTLAILGVVSFCFLGFLLLTSNPFLAATTVMTGNDLNPLLQDPGFVIHPPMLYMGYVGFSAAFAITLAALLGGKLTAQWAYLTRQFALAAWCFLTLGIMLGSWWAYRVLGWGGFWFWDPVENASLLPWLGGIALIHVLLLTEKRDAAKAWAVLLGIICFALSLLGTFLVRSGVLVSAHTFANDPARGVFLLILLAILITAALLIYIQRLPKLILPQTVRFPLFSREMGLLLNSGLLITAMSTILLGTIYPLILDALHLGAISVGAPYFNLVMMPLVFIVLFFMGFSALCRWQGITVKKLSMTVARNFLLCLTSALALLYLFTDSVSAIAIISLTLSFWVILSLRGIVRSWPGMSIAHLGFAILVIGIMLSSLLNTEREVRIKPGDSTAVGPYQFLFLDTSGIEGSNYRGLRADFDVTKNGRHIVTMYPEKRIYLVRDTVMTKVDIHPGIFRDLYIALGEPLDQQYWSVRIYYKPFIRWIWFGGLLMMVGGILAMLSGARHSRVRSNA